MSWNLFVSKDGAMAGYTLSHNNNVSTLVADYRLYLPNKVLLESNLRGLT